MFSSCLFGIDLWGWVGRKWSQQHWSGLQAYLWNPWWRAFCYQGSQSGTAEMWRAYPCWRMSGISLRRQHLDMSVKLSKHLRAAGTHWYTRIRVPELLISGIAFKAEGFQTLHQVNGMGIPYILSICLSTWTGFVSLVSPVILRTTWCLSTASNRCNSIGGGDYGSLSLRCACHRAALIVAVPLHNAITAWGARPHG